MKEQAPVLSVVIPVYNAEKTLPETLESLLNQSLREIEVICVDDGSTDGSVKLIESYIKKDPRVRLCQQKNQYAGIARNTGIAAARGEWLFFLDADDYVMNYGLEAACDKGREYQLDFLKFMAFTYDEGRNIYVDKKRNNGGFLKPGDYDRLLKLEKGSPLLQVSVTPWSGIYRRAFVMEKNCRFNGLQCVNDRSFFMKILTNGERMMISRDRVTVHRENQSDSLVGKKALHFDCAVNSVRITEKQLREDGIAPEVAEAVMEQEYHDLAFWYRKYWTVEERRAEMDRLLDEYIHSGESPYAAILEEKLKQALALPPSPPAKEVKPFHKACEQPAVSVIVPMRGTEHLNRMLDNLTRQTLEEIEFVVVNDSGSPQALTVVKEYAEVDGRFRAVEGPGGDLSQTLGRGIESARGEYIGFVFPEDLEKPDLYERLLQEVRRYRLDLVQGDYQRYRVLPEGRMMTRPIILSSSGAYYGRVMDPARERELFFLPANPRCGLYRRSLLKAEEEAFRGHNFWLRALARSHRVRLMREQLYQCQEDALEDAAPDSERLGQLHEDYQNLRQGLAGAGDRKELEGLLYDLELQNAMRLWNRCPPAEKEKGLELLRDFFREPWEKELFEKTHLGGGNQEWLALLMQAPEKLLSRVDLSMIIPVLSRPEDLADILKPLLAETTAILEILCVDASGQQETAEALKALERLDGRVRTLPAAGRTPGAARNEGLRAARGAYCFFPDAGDRLEADTLNVAWNLAEAEQLDVTILPSAIHDGLRAGATVSGGVWAELLPEKRPFAAEDVAQNLFQAVQTRVWDKLWRTAFLREKKLAFGEGDCGGDLPLVLPAVAQAARMDYVTGMPRIQHGLGEKVRTEEAPDTFYRMLLLARERLQKAGVYTRREQDFENFALHYALEQMTCQTPEAYPEIYGQMQSRWLEELGVLFRPRIYFFSGDDFKLMNRLRQENAVDYLLLTVRESRERLEALSRLPSAEEEMTKSPVYRAGMRVTWLPRKMRSAGRLLKEEGVGGTLRYALGKTPAP